MGKGFFSDESYPWHNQGYGGENISKKKWLLIIIVIAFITYVVVSKTVPGTDAAISSALGPTFGAAYNGIVQNSIWQSYIAPSLNSFVIGLVGGVILTIVLWKKGPSLKSKFTGATQSTPYQPQQGPALQSVQFQPTNTVPTTPASTPPTPTTPPVVDPTKQAQTSGTS